MHEPNFVSQFELRWAEMGLAALYLSWASVSNESGPYNSLRVLSNGWRQICLTKATTKIRSLAVQIRVRFALWKDSFILQRRRPWICSSVLNVVCGGVFVRGFPGNLEQLEATHSVNYWLWCQNINNKAWFKKKKFWLSVNVHYIPENVLLNEEQNLSKKNLLVFGTA